MEHLTVFENPSQQTDSNIEIAKFAASSAESYKRLKPALERLRDM
jgi:hypothetical protein